MMAGDLREFGLEALTAAARHAPLLSMEEEAELARRAATGCERSFERLLRCHLRLVLTLARDFRVYGLPLQDLVSEGLLGLVEAARRFDPDRGVRLAAYAAWWIRAYIRRYTIFNRRIVRTPSTRHGRRLLANLRRTQRDLAQATGSPADAHAVAAALGVEPRDVEEMEAALSGRDVSCGADADGRGLELPSDAPSPETTVAEHEDRVRSARLLRCALDELPAREQHILERRYLSDEHNSLAAIGRGMGLSRERVRQLEHQAQSRVREALLESA